MEPSVSLTTSDPVRGAVSIVRWTRAALGLGCFGLAGIGAVVPGLPTTIFLLMGSYLLTRSCPVLERRIRENRLFRPYVAYLDPTVPLPRRARLAALTAMWASIGVSALLIYARQPSPAVPLLLVAAGFVATVVILRFRSHLGR